MPAVAAAFLLLAAAQASPPGGMEARLGKAAYEKRDLQQAITHLRAAVAENPEDQESSQLLGLSFYSAGRFAEAIPPLERVQSRLPAPEFDGVYVLGVCYLKTGQTAKAREAFSRMFSVPPGSATAHLLFAQMMVRRRLEDQAVPELAQAISLDSRLPMAHFLLGEIYLYKSEHRRALEEFRKELEINPTVWLVYWRLGDAYARLQQYAEAERALKQAIWLNDSFTGSYILLGQIELKKGDVGLAAGFLERALKLDSNNHLAHYTLAKAYQQMGRAEDASRHFALSRSLSAERKDEEERFFQEAIR